MAKTRSKAIRSELLLIEYLAYLWPEIHTSRVPLWPPDVFGLSASALRKAGAYESIVKAWPPSRPAGSSWTADVKTIAAEWRKAWETDQPVPTEIQSRWSAVIGSGISLNDLRTNDVVRNALIELCVIADEACFGVGIPGTSSLFEEHARDRLTSSAPAGSSLCEVLHRSRVLVLPKLHTPKGGISIRSLTHNLALYEAGEVCPVWTQAPSGPNSLGLNLLVIPWPFRITPSQFTPCDHRGSLDTMPDCYGFFDFRPTDDTAEVTAEVIKTVEGLITESKRLVARIDGVVFPELALTKGTFDALSPNVLRHRAFLLSGIWESNGPKQPATNRMSLDLPLYQRPTAAPVNIDQPKHHRWCLDKSQIVQYGLGSSLDPMRSWWEHTTIEPRKIHFVAMRRWLTMTALICEDLVRREPVDEVLRSVGPNLVIALLMDGPQLATRWPARYATVLAEDPGSSVLTLTNLGMAELCRPPGKAASRSIGLWKDAKTQAPIELELPPGCGALVLSLAIERYEEWSADGRSDGGRSGYPILAGVHPVRLEPRAP